MILNTRVRGAAPGFTLIEMLVVIAIIVVLMSLVGVVYTKSIENQRNRSTDDLANRLQPALEAEYDAVVQQAAKDIRNNTVQQPQYSQVLTFCDNDPDRARAVWTAAKIRQHFPETFAEVSPTYLIPVCPGVTLTPLSTFREVSGLSGQTAQLQSAALLYIILAKKSAGSSGGFQADDVTTGMQMDIPFTGGSARAFRDGWGNPVAFQRWVMTENGNEVQSAPYVDAKKDIKINPNANRDPLDTAGKVIGWSNSGKRSQMAAAPFLFTGQNRLISVVSPGRNGVFESFGNDDLAGFRIRRLGEKGK